MIAIDTNILVYAHRAESQFYPSASAALMELARRPDRWAIPWPCIHEFYSAVTNPKTFKSPSPPLLVLNQIESILASPSLRLLSETEHHWAVLEDIVQQAGVRGRMIHDAKIAAICIQHGVREFWSADRDFSRFPKLKTVNPLLR